MAFNYLDELLKSQGGWGGDGPVGYELTPDNSNGTVSTLNGWGAQAAKEKNALDAMFQGAIMGGDIEKASRLAVTPQQQALLSVALGQRVLNQDYRARSESGLPTQAPPDLVKNYNDQQYTNVLRSQAEQDRQLKIQQMKDQSAKTQAETQNLQIKDPTAADWVMGPQGMYNKRTGEIRPLANQKGTVGQQAVDRNFAKDYADYQAGGGSADVDKQLTQLNQVIKDLGKAGNDYTGPVRGLVPDKLRSITNPDAVAAKNKVEEVAQRNLRLVLGAQFTQVEGERLIARAYNDQMPPSENERRVKALFDQIKTAAKTKEDAARYFEANGTLTGWKGRLPTLGDFDAAIDSVSKPESSNPVTTGDKGKLLFDAKRAIEKGAPREAVLQRLREKGITETP